MWRKEGERAGHARRSPLSTYCQSKGSWEPSLPSAASLGSGPALQKNSRPFAQGPMSSGWPVPPPLRYAYLCTLIDSLVVRPRAIHCSWLWACHKQRVAAVSQGLASAARHGGEACQNEDWHEVEQGQGHEGGRRRRGLQEGGCRERLREPRA